MNALVIGGTGAVGSSLVAELVTSSRWKRVVVLTRRPTDRFAGSQKVEVVVANFEDLETQTAVAGAGCDAAFNTMGVGEPTRSSREEVWRVDVEYAGAFARGCRSAGVHHLSLLSSAGANAQSRWFYIRVKGAAEEATRSGGVEHTSFFRPSLLVTREVRYGLRDRVARAVLPRAARMLPARYHPIRVEGCMQRSRTVPGSTSCSIPSSYRCSRRAD
jgi:Predicted nucleoside-diphosphate-sugar epimerases